MTPVTWCVRINKSSSSGVQSLSLTRSTTFGELPGTGDFSGGTLRPDPAESLLEESLGDEMTECVFTSEPVPESLSSKAVTSGGPQITEGLGIEGLTD